MEAFDIIAHIIIFSISTIALILGWINYRNHQRANFTDYKVLQALDKVLKIAKDMERTHGCS